MSDFKMETKWSGYEPGNGEPRVLRSTRAPRSVIQAVSRWGRLFDLEESDIFIPVFRTGRMMPLQQKSVI